MAYRSARIAFGWKTLPFCVALLVAMFTESALAQIRTVTVSPVPGDPIGSGTALRNALAGISSPSSSNPWLLKIEPGVYDVGSTSLQMRPWIDIEGSGIGVTTIRGAVDGSLLTAGTINGASNTELRLLTVTATGSASTPYVIGMFSDSASSLRIYRVRFVVQSSTAGAGAWGMRNVSSAPAIEECEFSVTATGSNSVAYGLVFRLFVHTGQRTSVLRSKIAASGATQNYGLFMIEAQTVKEIRDTRIDAVGGQTTYGIYATGPGWQGNESIAIRDVEVNSAGGSNASYGAWLAEGSAITLDVLSSKIWGHVAPTTYGIYQGGSSPMGLQGSSIAGFTKTIESTIGNVSIASTLLNGGPVSVGGWVGCMGVWDEGGVFYPNSCPP